MAAETATERCAVRMVPGDTVRRACGRLEAGAAVAAVPTGRVVRRHVVVVASEDIMVNLSDGGVTGEQKGELLRWMSQKNSNTRIGDVRAFPVFQRGTTREDTRGVS